MLTRASSLPRPTAAVILLHGRGASARDIMSLAPAINLPSLLFVAPHAAGGTWYPQSFLAPISQNQPGIDSAHAVIESLLLQLEQAGIPPTRVALMGFSQGACLTLDHACRFPRRYGAVIACTGGIIGPPGTPFPSAGDLAQTPVFIGANDPDPHVPWARVQQSAEHLRALGGDVDLRRYPGQPHAVLPDEIDAGRELLLSLAEPLAS